MSLESLTEKERKFWDAAFALVEHYGNKKALLPDGPWAAADAAFAALKPEPLVWEAHHGLRRLVRSDGVELSQIRMTPESLCPEMPGILAALNRYERERVEK